MSGKKNIPNPIINIGHSTRLNGVMSFDLDGSKVKKMKAENIQELLNTLDEVKKKVCTLRGGDFKVGNHILTPVQYGVIENFISENRLLMAVKAYKLYTGEGLKDSKDAIDILRERIRLQKQ